MPTIHVPHSLSTPWGPRIRRAAAVADANTLRAELAECRWCMFTLAAMVDRREGGDGWPGPAYLHQLGAGIPRRRP